MPKQSTSMNGFTALVLFKVLAGTSILLLSMSAGAWGQESGFQASATSVDEAFSTFHQALSAKASDLLAGVPRPLTGKRSSSDAPPTLDLGLGLNGQEAIEQAGHSVHPRQAVERVQSLRSMFEPILLEEGVPPELAAVVLVESGGLTTALSSKGARGLWQFMPETARRYGLIVTAAFDERLDPYKSTRAAARYLHDLYGQFGNWSLALAAYNAGEDIVQRAVDRTASRDFGFLARAGMLPLETRSYVPAVLKAIEILQSTRGGYFSTAMINPVINSFAHSVAEMENLR